MRRCRLKAAGRCCVFCLRCFASHPWCPLASSSSCSVLCARGYQRQRGRGSASCWQAWRSGRALWAVRARAVRGCGGAGAAGCRAPGRGGGPGAAHRAGAPGGGWVGVCGGGGPEEGWPASLQPTSIIGWCMPNPLPLRCSLDGSVRVPYNCLQLAHPQRCPIPRGPSAAAGERARRPEAPAVERHTAGCCLRLCSGGHADAGQPAVVRRRLWCVTGLRTAEQGRAR